MTLADELLALYHDTLGEAAIRLSLATGAPFADCLAALSSRPEAGELLQKYLVVADAIDAGQLQAH